MSTKKKLFEKNERYFIQGHVRMYTAKRKKSKVKIGCRRADFLKWPYFTNFPRKSANWLT